MDRISFETPYGEWSMAMCPPPPQLATIVMELWETSGAVGYDFEKLIPNGTVDCMINLGPPQRVLQSSDQDKPVIHSNAWLAGIRDGPLFAGPADNTGPFNTHFVGARLYPQAISAIFGIAAGDLANSVVNLDAIVGGTADQLRDRMGEAPTTEQRFGLLSQFLFETMARSGRMIDHRLSFVMAQLEGSAGNVRIDDLCASMEISRKHLNHIFKEMVGLTPKTFARLCRFRELMAKIDSDEADSWAHLALETGFFDHAHLIRDFRQFAGQSPQSFIRDRAPDNESVVYVNE